MVDDVDIIKVGTPFLIREGVNAIKTIKEKYPHKEVLADAKIMDGAILSPVYFRRQEPELCHGVKSVTDVPNDPVVHPCGKEAGKQVVVDMICVDDLPARVHLLERQARICWRYTPAPTAGGGERKPIDDLITMLKARRKARIAVAGGISSQTVKGHTLLDRMW